MGLRKNLVLKRGLNRILTSLETAKTELFFNITSSCEIEEKSYIKQRESFLKNYQLFIKNFCLETKHIHFDINDINEHGFTQNQPFKMPFDKERSVKICDFDVNYIPPLHLEKKTIEGNNQNINVLFLKYNILSFVTHKMNSLYGKEGDKLYSLTRQNIRSFLLSVMSCLLEICVPYNYNKSNDDIYLKEGKNYMLINKHNPDKMEEFKFLECENYLPVLPVYTNETLKERQKANTELIQKILKTFYNGDVYKNMNKIKSLINTKIEDIENSINETLVTFECEDQHSVISKIYLNPKEKIIEITTNREIGSKLLHGSAITFKGKSNQDGVLYVIFGLNYPAHVQNITINEIFKMENGTMVSCDKYTIKASLDSIYYEFDLEDELNCWYCEYDPFSDDSSFEVMLSTKLEGELEEVVKELFKIEDYDYVKDHEYKLNNKDITISGKTLCRKNVFRNITGKDIKNFINAIYYN